MSKQKEPLKSPNPTPKKPIPCPEHGTSIFINVSQKVVQKQNEGCWEAIKSCFGKKP